MLPAMNIRGLESGQVEERATNAIPTAAKASVDFRLFPNQTPQRVKELVERCLLKQGFHIEQVGKYMVRPLLSLERLSFSEKEGKVYYRYGEEAEAVERMDYLEFIARVTSHIPDKGQLTIRYFGLYANAHRGKRRKKGQEGPKLLIVEEACPRIPRSCWAETIRKVYEVDPLRCPKCQGQMPIIAFLTDYAAMDRIINHLKLTFVADKPSPPHILSQELLMVAEMSAEYHLWSFV